MKFLTKLNSKSAALVLLGGLCLAFFAVQIPLYDKPSSYENAAERQAQTAGIARMFCLDSSRFVFNTPLLPFGRRPFNYEFSLVEWLEARAAAAVSTDCEAVEPIARLAGIFFAALGLVAAFFLAKHICTFFMSQQASAAAGLLCALLLSTDWLWLKYASFTMVDSRSVTFGFLAMACSFYGRPFWAAAFWFLTLGQKPQAFAFIGTFYFCLELFLLWVRAEKRPWRDRQLRLRCISLLAGMAPALLYHFYSSRVNASSDLPWLAWTGPRAQKWFFGDWIERVQWPFYKSSLLEWIRKTGVVVTLLTVGLSCFYSRFAKGSGSGHGQENLNSKASFLKSLKTLIFFSAAFFIARFLSTAIFLNVFKAHEYYALPQNAFGAFSKGLLFSLAFWMISRVSKNRSQFGLAVLPLLLFIVLEPVQGVSKFLKFRRDVQDPNSSLYYHHWTLDLFPKKNGFVVIANPERGRDYMLLYLSRQMGHVWCHQNKEFAPRAFWQAEGVEYVAWPLEFDPVTRTHRWLIRTMKEELAYARAQGWSSDVNDVWKGRSMQEWAAFGSRTFQDPCTPGQYDPRKWKNF